MFAEKKFGLRVEQFSYITFIQPVFTGRPLLPPSCVCGKSASTPYTSPKFKIFQLDRFDQTTKSDAKMQQANPLEKHMFKLETEELYNIHYTVYAVHLCKRTHCLRNTHLAASSNHDHRGASLKHLYVDKYD